MVENHIKILPEDLVNKIAAGEVVERPASVVKELIENSIDAGATQINIEIQDAGKKLIRVSDNGCGMAEEEIKIALERHSTSKINSLEDLFNIKTLGFRGEALPSIASVSKTKIERNLSGQGVTAEVKNLFYNTPARKKFLKSNTTETGHIGDIVSKYTLAYPQIAFKFVSDGKPLITSAGTGKLADAILAVYGADLVKELIEVDSSFPAGRVFGFVSRPTLSRIDKNYESLFVNRRYIRNFLLNRALEEAYRTLIPGNRYPVGIVFIDIDPRQVDVNVHPTKREVKFVNNQVVMDAVKEAVAKALQNVLSPMSYVLGREEVGGGSSGTAQINFDLSFSEDMGEGRTIEVSAIQPLFPIYQLKNTYIIATDGYDLFIIDQHAAHERIVYDQLSQKSDTQASQALLVPETIELNPQESMMLSENLEYLNSLGFELEEFGVNSFILRAVPAVTFRSLPKELIKDMICDLKESQKTDQIEILEEKIRKSIACHSAIKAGDKLSQQEMNQLIRDLFSTQNPQTCPHGRPTMIKINEDEICRKFAR